MFQFDSVQDFLLMAGHGPYVWVSYGVSLIVMGYLVVAPYLRAKQVTRELKARKARANHQRN